MGIHDPYLPSWDISEDTDSKINSEFNSHISESFQINGIIPSMTNGGAVNDMQSTMTKVTPATAFRNVEIRVHTLNGDPNDPNSVVTPHETLAIRALSMELKEIDGDNYIFSVKAPIVSTTQSNQDAKSMTTTPQTSTVPGSKDTEVPST